MLLHPTIAYFDDPAKWQLNPEPLPSAAAAVRELETTGEIVEMNSVYGACLLLPASVMQTVGMLDERFFLQLEESDYFLRAKALNISSFCARRAQVPSQGVGEFRWENHKRQDILPSAQQLPAD